MSIDISSETLLSFSEAAQRLPSHPHLSSLHRWRQHGVNGVKLESVKIGGKRFTSLEALERFSAKTTAAADQRPLPSRSSTDQKRAVEEAANEIGVNLEG